MLHVRHPRRRWPRLSISLSGPLHSWQQLLLLSSDIVGATIDGIVSAEQSGNWRWYEFVLSWTDYECGRVGFGRSGQNGWTPFVLWRSFDPNSVRLLNTSPSQHCEASVIALFPDPVRRPRLYQVRVALPRYGQHSQPTAPSGRPLSGPSFGVGFGRRSLFIWLTSLPLGPREDAPTLAKLDPYFSECIHPRRLPLVNSAAFAELPCCQSVLIASAAPQRADNAERTRARPSSPRAGFSFTVLTFPAPQRTVFPRRPRATKTRCW
jgi:hypothetical protein